MKRILLGIMKEGLDVFEVERDLRDVVLWMRVE